MKKILLFGAAFDPPHLGHELMVREALRLEWWDGVWLLPAKRHPFSKQLAPTAQRLAMLQLLVVDLADPRVRVEEYELNQDVVGYTYRTLKALSANHPNDDFSFLVGSDNLAQFHRWDQYQQMLDEFPFYVYPRSGFPLRPLYPGMIPLSDVEQVNISSTQVRNLIKDKQSVSHLILPQIAEYIEQHQLYTNLSKPDSGAVG